MTIDIEKLKRLSQEAIESIAKKQQEDAERKKKEAEVEAAGIIGMMSEIAEFEARAGSRCAAIMSLKDFKCELQQRQHAHFSDCLSGAGKIVYDYCYDNGLKPTIEKNLLDGYAIVIHW
jgi:hypothetical protein